VSFGPAPLVESLRRNAASFPGDVWRQGRASLRRGFDTGGEHKLKTMKVIFREYEVRGF